MQGFVGTAIAEPTLDLSVDAPKDIPLKGTRLTDVSGFRPRLDLTYSILSSPLQLARKPTSGILGRPCRFSFFNCFWKGGEPLNVNVARLTPFTFRGPPQTVFRQHVGRLGRKG
jgi:hypothetical protein